MTDTEREDRFNPAERMGQIQGRDYLDVANRVLWLTTDEAHYTVDTDIVHVNDQSAVVKATVTLYTEEGTVKRRATGHGRAAMATMPKHIASRFLEKAETAALGRALAALGYGTLAAQTFDDTDGPHLADTPAGGAASDEWKAAQTGAPASGARPPNRAPAASAPPALAPTLQGDRGWIWPPLGAGKLPPRRLEFRGGPNERAQQFLAACAQYLQLQQGDIQRALGGGLKDYMAAEKARRLAAADGSGDPITYGYEDVYATLWDLSREDESPAVRLLADDRAPVTA